MQRLKKLILILLAVFLVMAAKAGAGNLMLDLYAQLTGRTLLYSSSLPAKLTGFTTPVSETNAALAFIEAQFKKLNMQPVPDGQKFLRILPTNWQSSPLATQLDRISLPAQTFSAPTNNVPSGINVPSGTIYFENVQMEQFLNVYAAIRQRTVLWPSALSGRNICLKSQTTLTKAEFIYACNVSLILNGVAITDDGDKFVQMVPIGQAAQVQALAPKAETGAVLITPDQVRAALPESNLVSAALPPPRPIGKEPHLSLTANRLADYYAELSQRKFVPLPREVDTAISFKPQTRLTEPEMRYAIATTLALNHFKIVNTDANSLTLALIPERP